MKIVNHLIGADIEVFLKDEVTSEIVSAEGIAKGTKHKPFNFDESNKYFATSLDNVLYEYCIPPTQCMEDFVNNINKSLKFVKSTLPKGLDLATIASAFLNEKYLQTRNAKLFGCEPDYNVWTREPNMRPKAEDNTLRSAGFHVHVGFENPEIDTTEELIKAMDLFLGVPSVLIDSDKNRRNLYGKAGSFRLKEYGAEYRTLSGFFASTEELYKWVYNNTERAILWVNEYGYLDEDDGVKIQHAINDNDTVTCQNLINEYKIDMP